MTKYIQCIRKYQYIETSIQVNGLANLWIDSITEWLWVWWIIKKVDDSVTNVLLELDIGKVLRKLGMFIESKVLKVIYLQLLTENCFIRVSSLFSNRLQLYIWLM